MDAGLQKTFAVAGNKSELARKLGLRPQTVIQWDLIPWWWLERVSHVTGLPIYSLHPVLRNAEQEIRADERRRLVDAGRLQQLGAENTEL